MKRIVRLWALMVAMLTFMPTQSSAEFVGVGKPSNNGNYYLYNVYQGKFLCYLNTDSTKVALAPFGDSRILKCTVESKGANYLLNTHYSLTTKSWDASVTNYFSVRSGVPYVNNRYGDSDPGTAATPTRMYVAAADEGYYIYANATQYLMFDYADRCTIGDKSESFNADKSLWRFISEEEYEAKLKEKRFTAVAMNVDGMPKSLSAYGVNIDLNPDAKEADGARAIGRKLVGMGYDFIGVSEDFNYNDEILSEIGSVFDAGTHRGRLKSYVGILTKYLAKDPLFDTDGLNFFWKRDNVTASWEWWEKWNDHYGYDKDGADGLIKKGYRYYLITLPDGVSQVDVYIHHMDAETSDGDLAARASQLTQLADHIKATNNGRPIIVMGDTNCRYTRDRLKELFIDALNADPRFTCRDPWIDMGRRGLYPGYGGEAIMAWENGYRQGEVVDKLFYINNTDSKIRLVAETYTQDLSFVNEAGEPLADHWPCAVMFTYHDYDPAIDDEQPIEEEGWDNVYLRNVSTGEYLKGAGLWGTHAALGTYGIPVNIKPMGNSQYVIQTNMGGGYLSGDSYIDGEAYIWTLIERGDYYSFKSGALSLSRGAKNAYAGEGIGPNTYQVTTSATSSTSKLQQWEFLTLADLKREMLAATPENPYNCTFLLPGANFDRNDLHGNSVQRGGSWNCTISDNASKMTYTFSNGLITDSDEKPVAQGNPVAEVFNSSYGGITSYESRWDVTQTLTDIPNGRYRVTCQGFYRDGEVNQSNPGAIHSFLYARSGDSEGRTALQSIYSAACTTALSSTQDNNGYYIPNSMNDASLFFNAGYYCNQVEVVVTNGTMTLGIGKPDVTKSTSGWTCFDNFQIFYLTSSTGAQETGVEAVVPAVADTEAAVYDLSGRRVKGNMRPGIYLQNGKKVIRK